jgi:hypothetical protein
LGLQKHVVLQLLLERGLLGLQSLLQHAHLLVG